MSLNHMQQFSGELVDDILLLIFDYLDEEDLVNCETVCCRWRKLIQSYVWKKIFHVKVNHFPLWQNYCKQMEKNKRFSQLESWEKYKIISREIKMLHDNWWTGNFVQHIHSFDFDLFGDVFNICENYFVSICDDQSLYVFERPSMKLKHKITAWGSRITCFRMKNDVIMCGTTGRIKVYHLITGMQVNDILEPNGWTVEAINFRYGDLIAAISKSSTDPSCHLTFWSMKSCCEITYLDHISIPEEENCSYGLWIDDNFVVVCQYGIVASRIFIVSTKTRTIVEKMKFPPTGHMRYDNGLIFIQFPSFIRVGSLSYETPRPTQFFVDIVPECDGEMKTAFRTNSKYLAVFWALNNRGSRVTLFDLQAIKKTKANVAFNFEVPFLVYRLEMDETQVICMGSRRWRDDSLIVVFDFARKPLSCVKGEKKLPSSYVKSEVLNYILPNQVESIDIRNIPFSLCIYNEWENESRKYYDFFKWLFAVPMCSLLFLKIVKNQKM